LRQRFHGDVAQDEEALDTGSSGSAAVAEREAHEAALRGGFKR
jgi:hypothetical protein